MSLDRPNRFRKVMSAEEFRAGAVKKAKRRMQVVVPVDLAPVYHADGRVTIALPLPPRSLSPNGRTHPIGKSKVTKRFRWMAKVKMTEALDGRVMEFRGHSLAFFHATNRRRDDDNAAASCKAYRDGIADALGIDDHRLPTVALPSFGKDADRPRVEITLWTAEEKIS